MGDPLALRLAQDEARKVAVPAAEARAAAVANEVAASVAADVAGSVALRTANERLPADVAAFLAANPPAPGSPGAPGTNGTAGLVWRGTWRRGATYETGDGVAFKGSSYIAIAPSKGAPPPSSGWDLLAEKGDAGESVAIPGGGGGRAILHDGTRVGYAAGLDFTGGSAVTIDHGIARVPVGSGGGGSLPAGGTTGQVLTKESNADGDADWEDPVGGSTDGLAHLATEADIPLWAPGLVVAEDDVYRNSSGNVIIAGGDGTTGPDEPFPGFSSPANDGAVNWIWYGQLGALLLSEMPGFLGNWATLSPGEFVDSGALADYVRVQGAGDPRGATIDNAGPIGFTGGSTTITGGIADSGGPDDSEGATLLVGGGTTSDGGHVGLTGGTGHGASDGGRIDFQAGGNADTAGTGAAMEMHGGGAHGGQALFAAGDAGAGSGGHGGNFDVQAGAGDGAGAPGTLGFVSDGTPGTAGDILASNGSSRATWQAFMDVLVAAGGQAANVPPIADPTIVTPEALAGSFNDLLSALVSAGLMAA